MNRAVFHHDSAGQSQEFDEGREALVGFQNPAAPLLIKRCQMSDISEGILI